MWKVNLRFIHKIFFPSKYRTVRIRKKAKIIEIKYRCYKIIEELIFQMFLIFCYCCKNIHCDKEKEREYVLRKEYILQSLQIIIDILICLYCLIV